MSRHIAYDHRCPSCRAPYIPYEAVECPQCGTYAPERFDFIPQAVATLRAHQEKWGTYTPGAWTIGSLADHVLNLLFGLLDLYDDDDRGLPFDAFAASYLHRLQWGNQPYLESHLLGIALRVRQELDRLLPPAQGRLHPFRDHPPVEAAPYQPGWVQCPSCGKRFSLTNPNSWSGTRHRTCGQRLRIEGSSP